MMTLTEPMTRKTMALAGSERRRGLRIAQERPVKIYEPRMSRYFGGKTCDVSTTGLRIELPAFATVQMGETVNIHVGLSNSGQSLANRRNMMPARVVWVDREEGSGKVEVGVEFVSTIRAHLDAA